MHPAVSQTPAQRLHPVVGVGEKPERRPGSGQEFHALRDYRSGDDPRQVHWRSTARVGRLVSVEREAERRRRITLLVDGRGMGKPEALDAGAEAAVALARRYLQEGCEVGLSWPGGSLAPGAGTGHLGRLADAAARLEPAHPGAPAPRVHRGSHPLVVPLAAPRREPVRPETRVVGVGSLGGGKGG